MAQKRDNLALEIILNLLREESHGRALSEKLGASHASVQRALIDLAKKNVLDFKYEGKNKVYFLKRNMIARRHIYLAEHFKFVRLIERYPLLEPIVEEIVKKCTCPLILLFGSYAKFNAKKDSDIDIYIETESRSMKKEIECINSRLKLKIGAFDLNSLLIKEIMKNHVIIRGIELYYEKIRFFK